MCRRSEQAAQLGQEKSKICCVNPVALGSINVISQGLSLAAKRQALQRLDQLGLRLLFSRLPAGWIPAVQPADLTAAVQGSAPGVSAVGYSTIGTLYPGSHTSARFWPTSPFYQARLGGYLVHSPTRAGLVPESDPASNLLIQTVVADQTTWLKNYGCPEPEVSLNPDSFRVLENDLHQEHPAWLIEGTICSNSDIGAANRYSGCQVVYRTYELMFQRFGGVHLPALCTLPPIWPLASYHRLELDFLGLFIQIGKRGHWALLYCCGTRWAGRDYFPELRPAALEALHQVRIVSA